MTKSNQSAPVTTSGSHVYLRPRTKAWLLGIGLALMIAASVTAVLQPLNPDPQGSSFAGWAWYPHETNPVARLQQVSCSKPYACQLNSVAINGESELPEIWAVGNVGLVLHRPAGQTKWEQLTVSAKEESVTAPPPSPKPRPAPNPAPTAAPVKTPSSAVVPNLVGLSQAEAEKAAYAAGFNIQVDYGAGTNPMAQQQVGPLRVLRQSPEPKTSAPPKSTIKITLGALPRSAAQLIWDKIFPTVYAAEPVGKAPGKRPPQAQQQESHGRMVPDKTPDKQPDRAHNISGMAKPVVISPVLDDLILATCYTDRGCRIVGRSGRIYKPQSPTEWTFVQGRFVVSDSAASGSYPGTEPGLPAEAVLQSTSIGKLYASKKNGFFNCESYKGNEVFSAKPVFGCTTGKDPAVPNATAPQNVVIKVPTTATTRAVAFVFSPKQLYVEVGDAGVILSSKDGTNWLHETQGPEGAVPNHRLPGTWYWALSVLMIIGCAVVVAWPVPPAAAEVSVADWTVTDAPLKPGDVDSLNFTPMALGLSRFIRNPKTQPPVTIAIEGAWGEGKSSVMSLLKADLEKSRYRPVWFNAWHHQSEEQLLAALIEHIRDQAIPPIWHIDNWIFRWRLLTSRFGQMWPMLLALAMILVGAGGFEYHRHGLNELLNDPVSLIPFHDYIPGLKSAAASDSAATNPEKTAATKLADAKSVPSATADTQSAADKSRVSEDTDKEARAKSNLGHLGVLASLIAFLGGILKAVRAFGIDPSKITDNLRDASMIKDVKPDPGIRRQFAREFGDFCKAWAWGSRRVIIFIDDLDRCRPESVVTVLESVNFLTTAGDCVIVLGMAQEQVTHCVGLSFQEIAHSEAAFDGKADTEQEKAKARFAYGDLYIRKLVNIVAHLPKTTPEQRRLVLEAKAAEVQRSIAEQPAMPSCRLTIWEWMQQAGWLAVKTAPLGGIVLAVALSCLIGYTMGTPSPVQQAATAAAASSGANSSGQAASSETKEQPWLEGVAKPLIYPQETSEPAVLRQSPNANPGFWGSLLVDLFFLVILFGILIYELSARSNQDALNSAEFDDALRIWGEYIVGICDTPREIKRTLNDLRYQAMTRRSNGPTATRGEKLLKTVRQFVTGRREPEEHEAHVDEAALPPRKAALLANLTNDQMKVFLDPTLTAASDASASLKLLLELRTRHMQRFSRWIEDQKPQPAAMAASASPGDAGPKPVQA